MQISSEQLIILFIFVFIVGTVIGSFLNVVILRAFSGESIVMPPSKCPQCGNKLKWWHNIPILSYILLRGKCGFCKEHISIQYPIVEFITGVLFLLTFLKFGIRIETLFGFLIVSLLVVISVTDIKEQVAFDNHTYTLIGTGLVYSLYRTITQVIQANQSSLFFTFSWDWFLHSPIVMSITGGLAGALAMFLLIVIGKLLSGKESFGEGDIFILAGLGTIFGLYNVLLLLLLGAVFELIIIVPMFIKNLIQQKDWKCLISLTTLVIISPLYCFISYSPVYYNEILSYVLLGLVLLNLIAVCYYILKGIKTEKNITYIPFGPFLSAAGLVALLLPHTLGALIYFLMHLNQFM